MVVVYRVQQTLGNLQVVTRVFARLVQQIAVQMVSVVHKVNLLVYVNQDLPEMATSMQIHIARRVQLIHTKQPHRILLVRHALLDL